MLDSVAMSGFADEVVFGVALIALVATLAASELLVRGVGAFATNLGLLGGIVGLIVALGADSPEISSSISAVASGSAATAGGVVFGSNIFNIAVLLGGAAIAVGEVRVHRAAVVLDAGAALAVTVAIGLTVLGVLPTAVGWFVMLVVFLPYVGVLIARPARLERLRVTRRLKRFLLDASRETAAESVELESEIETLMPSAADRRWRPVLLVIPALVLIVFGSFVLVQSAVTLGGRWHVSSLLIGVIALAAATSLPNAYAAVRLAIDGHGAAVVSATFNSNTLNLVAGIAVPLLFFPALRHSIPTSYVVWLLGMSLLALVLLARGLRRGGAIVLLAAYLAFVGFAIATQ
jgi:cation:H+ antiporter